jgi:hypothetical protein
LDSTGKNRESNRRYVDREQKVSVPDAQPIRQEFVYESKMEENQDQRETEPDSA